MLENKSKDDDIKHSISKHYDKFSKGKYKISETSPLAYKLDRKELQDGVYMFADTGQGINAILTDKQGVNVVSHDDSRTEVPGSTLAHSLPAGGGAVVSAGWLQIQRGGISSLNGNSGHYQPSSEDIYGTLNTLRTANVILPDALIAGRTKSNEPLFKVDDGGIRYREIHKWQDIPSYSAATDLKGIGLPPKRTQQVNRAKNTHNTDNQYTNTTVQFQHQKKPEVYHYKYYTAYDVLE